jgi:hypothetical protein
LLLNNSDGRRPTVSGPLGNLGFVLCPRCYNKHLYSLNGYCPITRKGPPSFQEVANSIGSPDLPTPREGESKFSPFLRFAKKHPGMIAGVIVTGLQCFLALVAKAPPPQAVPIVPIPTPLQQAATLTQTIETPVKLGCEVLDVGCTFAVEEYNKGGFYLLGQQAGIIVPSIFRGLSIGLTMGAYPSERTVNKGFEFANAISGPAIRIGGRAKGMDDEDLKLIYLLSDMALGLPDAFLSAKNNCEVVSNMTLKGYDSIKEHYGDSIPHNPIMENFQGAYYVSNVYKTLEDIKKNFTKTTTQRSSG